MSIGLYEHPHLGLVRRYILSNRYILESSYNEKAIENWLQRFNQFQHVYLKGKKIQYVFFPEEIFTESQDQNSNDKKTLPGKDKINIIYDHYVLTLQDELKQRILNNQPFGQQQLWYLLYSLVQAAQELTQIHAIFTPQQNLVIHPQTILLNELGGVKLMSYHSTPTPITRQTFFQTPTEEDQPLFRKFLLSASYAIGRTMASLMLLKQLESFRIASGFDQIKFEEEWKPVRQKYGILGNIIAGMLQGIPEQRILVHQISALLSPYSQCLLNIEGFRLDRSLCRQAMLSTFVSP